MDCFLHISFGQSICAMDNSCDDHTPWIPCNLTFGTPFGSVLGFVDLDQIPRFTRFLYRLLRNGNTIIYVYIYTYIYIMKIILAASGRRRTHYATPGIQSFCHCKLYWKWKPYSISWPRAPIDYCTLMVSSRHTAVRQLYPTWSGFIQCRSKKEPNVTSIFIC